MTTVNAGIEGLNLHEEAILYFQERVKKGFNAVHSDFSVDVARTLSANLAKSFAGSTEFNGTEWEIMIPSCNNSAGIPVTVFKPNSLPSKPSIFVYFHGGGFVVGSRKTTDPACKAIARYSFAYVIENKRQENIWTLVIEGRQVNNISDVSGPEASCIVLNVEYRLAPENKIPACNEDAAEVVTWVLANKQRVGGAAESAVGVGGSSAGGQIAADVCHEIVGISYQILIYPKVDLKLDRPSYVELKNGPILPEPLLKWYMEMACEKNYNSAKGIPMNRDSFNRLPPALFIVAEFDPLRDDSYDYEKKLKDAGVETELLLLKGLVHAFINLPGVFKESTKLTFDKMAEFIRKHS